MEKHAMDGKVMIPRGEVIGIGKVKLNQTSDFNYVIQMLAFLVIKEKDGGYVSSCIHLNIDGYGKTDGEAIIDMIDSVRYFLVQNFTDPKCKDRAWENLEELFMANDWSNEMWDAYHKIQIRLSMQGKSADDTEYIRKWIANLQRRVERLESKEAAEIGQELAFLNDSLIGYETVEAA